jgi:hypothetical protein
MLRINKWGIFLGAIFGAGAVMAQSEASAPDKKEQAETCRPTAGSKQAVRGDGSLCLRYSWGLGIRASDIGGNDQNFRLRPSLGLEYGRWSLGVLSADDWLGYSGLRKQSSLAYRLSDDPKWKTRLSLSATNVNTGEGLDSLEGGRYTLRARFAVGYQYSPRVQIGGDISHDLLRRGAGTALSLGATRNIPLSEKTMLIMNANTTIGNVDFWNGSSTAATVKAGWGSVGLGLGLRHKLTEDWAIFGQVASSTPVGVLRDAGFTRTGFSGRAGFIKFGIW